jgi:hypothetical protein
MTRIPQASDGEPGPIDQARAVAIDQAVEEFRLAERQRLVLTNAWLRDQIGSIPARARAAGT